MNLKEKITLKLAKPETGSAGTTNIWLPAGLFFCGVCWVLYKLFTMSPPEPAATTAKGIGICILVFVIWGIKSLRSEALLKSRQLKEDIILYELTPQGITNHKGDFQRWDTLKKIYFRGGIVHFSYVTLNRQAPFSMSSEGISNTDFYEACEFIKAHAPKEVTKSLKLQKIPKY